MSNILKFEQSSYLLQHANDPVNWLTWSKKSFDIAKNSKQIIFLSIGYPSSRWCQIMQYKCFQDSQISEILNKHFTCIKIDREERPDIDAVYQSAHFIMSKTNGGWPLSVFIHPNTMMPIFSGLYFEKESFIELIKHISAEAIKNYVQLASSQGQVIGLLNKSVDNSMNQINLNQVSNDYISKSDIDSDANSNGYNQVNKLPQPTKIDTSLFIWRTHELKEDKAVALIYQITKTLSLISTRGLMDHVEGGFFTDSSDEDWHIPHFEKTLYDNSLLSNSFINAYLATKEEFYKEVALKTIQWVNNNLRNKSYLYYSSLHADENHREENYYLIDKSRIKKILNTADANLFFKFFQLIKLNGANDKFHYLIPKSNFQESFIKNNKSLSRLIDKVAADRKLSEYTPKLNVNLRLSWNGLMIKSLIRGARFLKIPELALLALESLESINRNHWDGNKLIGKKNKKTNTVAPTFLDDYACVADALIELIEYKWDDDMFYLSKNIIDKMIEDFWDYDEGFWFSSHKSEPTLFRPKLIFDEATPSGYGVAIVVLTKMGLMSSDNHYLKIAKRAIELQARVIKEDSRGCPSLIYASHFYNMAKLIIFRGGLEEITAWSERLDEGFHPHLISVKISSKVRNNLFDKSFPSTKDAVAYICGKGYSTGPIQNENEVFESIKTQ